jgi:hypothetical protein
MRMGRVVRMRIRFHTVPQPSRKESTNTPFPIQCRLILAVTWEVACTWVRNNHTTRLQTSDLWAVHMAVPATLHGILEMNSTHTRRHNIPITIPACNLHLRPIIPNFITHANQFPQHQTHRILSAGQTRNHSIVLFSVSNRHISRTQCSLITTLGCLRRTIMDHLLSDHLHISAALRAV